MQRPLGLHPPPYPGPPQPRPVGMPMPMPSMPNQNPPPSYASHFASTGGNHTPYPNNSPYPRSPCPAPGYPSYPSNPPGYHQHHHGVGDHLKTAAAIGGPLAAATAMYHGHKKLKKSKLKKAMKYGLPIAGVGVGAYALKKAFGHSSSSSSSSSDSD